MNIAVAAHDVKQDALLPPVKPDPPQSGSWLPSASGSSC